MGFSHLYIPGEVIQWGETGWEPREAARLAEGTESRARPAAAHSLQGESSSRGCCCRAHTAYPISQQAAHPLPAQHPVSTLMKVQLRVWKGFTKRMNILRRTICYEFSSLLRTWAGNPLYLFLMTLSCYKNCNFFHLFTYYKWKFCIKRNSVLIQICTLDVHFDFLTTTHIDNRNITCFALHLLHAGQCSGTSCFLPVQG